MKSKPYSIVTGLTLIISIGLYVISLTQECYCVTGSCGNHWLGIYIVAFGAIGGIMSTAGLTWYANPMIWAAWSLINKKPKRAVFFSLAATITSAAFLLATQVSDEVAGKSSYITDHRLGYWLWLASMATMLVGSIVVYFLKRNDIAHHNSLILLKVDFNNRCNGGIRLTTNGAIYKQGKTKTRLYDGLQAIIWDVDYNDRQTDNLAVTAIISFSYADNCWVAKFNYDDLMHESQREKPLLDNWD